MDKTSIKIFVTLVSIVIICMIIGSIMTSCSIEKECYTIQDTIDAYDSGYEDGKIDTYLELMLDLEKYESTIK